MMALLSLAWWTQKLSGVAAQAVYIVAGIAVVVLGLFWLRHDARLDERRAWDLRMANARIANGIATRKRERDSYELGNKAERALGEELDLAAAENEKLLKRIREIPASCNGVRPVCYPAAIIKELNR